MADVWPPHQYAIFIISSSIGCSSLQEVDPTPVDLHSFQYMDKFHMIHNWFFPLCQFCALLEIWFRNLLYDNIAMPTVFSFTALMIKVSHSLQGVLKD